jgi:proteasome accessory factor A
VLVNGARFYNDHGHPEYATPECGSIVGLVAHELAGERIVLRAAKRFEAKIGARVRVYKNNTDYHGASYGSHESYLVRRAVGFDRLLKGLLPLLIVRPILTGSGKVGSEAGLPCRFQLSQRADYFREVANVETLYRRPIFNTRDEPHADPEQWIRLHVICGDANRMPWAIAMKAGMMRIALQLVEIGEAPAWNVCSPVTAAEKLSKDQSGEWNIELEDGRWTNGFQMLDSYLVAGERTFKGQDAEMDWCLAEWRLAMDALQSDPMQLCDRVDWAAKKRLFEVYARELGSWDAATMQSLELEYHNLDPEESLFAALEQSGEVRQIVPESRVLDAQNIAPQDTRARLRGELIRRYSERIATVGWRRCVLRFGDEDRVFEFPIDAFGGIEPRLFDEIERLISKKNEE